MRDAFQSIAGVFEIPGELSKSEPLGSGHIHDTWVATYDRDGTATRYVHQRINTRVFRDCRALMRNLTRVTEHLRAKLADRCVADPDRRCLRLIPTLQGTASWVGPEGDTWRTFLYVEGTRSFDSIQSPNQARRVAHAFGAFAADLSDLPPPALAATIPHFHDLEHRVEALASAVANDARGRGPAASLEIDACEALHDRVSRLLMEVGADHLPLRTVHNDCKINNVLLDTHTGEALCVIDLDTVMDGTVLYDFGELVRTGACPFREDETDGVRMHVDLDLLEALARGYREGAAPILSDHEVNALPAAGPALALENGLRFLTDHLAGDVYFRIHREGHNLERCRAQLRRVELLLESIDAIRAAVG
jgi:Ser/Thr protein kinase RdoA (MazF antagonist)